LRWGILSTANITNKLLDSGSDQEFVAVGSRDAALAAGAEAFLPKPVDMDELVRAVGAALGLEAPRVNALARQVPLLTAASADGYLCTAKFARAGRKRAGECSCSVAMAGASGRTV
jgi:CheY-like chemotaxis protein